MEIRNQTIIQSDEINLLAQSKFTKINPTLCIISIVLFGLITLASMIMKIGLKIESIEFLYVIFSAIGFGLSIGLYIVSKRLLPGNMNNNFYNGVHYSYIFKEDCFDVDAEMSGQTSHSSIRYSSLYDVKDRGTYAMIFISRAQFFPCKYDGFHQNEKDECMNKLFLYKRKKN